MSEVYWRDKKNQRPGLLDRRALTERIKGKAGKPWRNLASERNFEPWGEKVERRMDSCLQTCLQSVSCSTETFPPGSTSGCDDEEGTENTPRGYWSSTKQYGD
ncbi:hypothetical protein Bbelb_374530 [Branchiostoma belcheri]|nr:hypothetical protein Bbelb_374530 [Branchiostoma belcheri]